MVSCVNCLYCVSEIDIMGKQLSEQLSDVTHYFCIHLNIIELDAERADFCTFFSPNRREESIKRKNAILDLKRELFLDLPKQEISERFDISKGYAGMLRSALKKEKFEALIQEDISPLEISKELGISESSVKAYLTALKKVGFLSS